MLNKKIKYNLLNGFQDPRLNAIMWDELLKKSTSNVVFLTWHWQKIWWDVFGRGKLILIMVEENEIPIAIAPLFSDGGMIFIVGSGGSDYLDMIGDLTNPDILEGILLLAAEQVPDFVGFRFYHILESSQLPYVLEVVADKLGWKLFTEDELISPLLELKELPIRAKEVVNKKSLVRHENWFKQNGNLDVEHLSSKEEISPHLEDFFLQHIKRWESSPFPSLFLEKKNQLFYQKLVEAAEKINWLCFSRIIWESQTIAFHFGFHFNKSFLWYKPTFNVNLAKRSPGEVLIRQLLLRAIESNVHYFDFGLGDEPFKKRFASKNRLVRNWGLYPQNF